MKRFATAVAAATIALSSGVAMADDGDSPFDMNFNGIEDKREVAIAKMMMELVEADQLPINHLTVPGFIMVYADLDNDGQLNELEQRRALRRLRQIARDDM